jgi:pantoate--beta-alanine ligase
MQVFKTKKELSLLLNNTKNSKKTIGFVPTMGALHNGHISLLKNALAENDLVVLSIFVNPTQFNNPEDLKKYPRTLEKDIELVKLLDENIIVYSPETSDLYEDKTESKKYNYGGIEYEMEGKHRPGHFDGVGTVVEKLFDIVKPNKAYFGEKDFQQLQIIKRLVKNYKIDVEIVGCPILREENGLAMSSRNERLSPEARDEAKLIYETLQKSVTFFKTHSPKQTIQWVTEIFKKHPNFTLEYFDIAYENNLKTVKRKSDNEKYRGFIAIFIENIRLIDNIAMN